jgi:hypothetical protein
MNRMSLLLVTLLAASFAVGGHPPQGPPAAEQRNTAAAARSSQLGSGQTGAFPPDLQAEAEEFLARFLSKEKAFDAGLNSQQTSSGFNVLFATLADPVQTHLAPEFDHDLAALQDGVQDSGYLLDSSWIPWDFPRNYDDLGDQLQSKQLLELKHNYPGILLFRRKLRHNPDGRPYAEGLIVFLLAEKPTTGVDTTQAGQALELLAKMHTQLQSQIEQQPSAGRSDPPFVFPDDTALIAGPTFSGSLDSLVPLLYEFRLHDKEVTPPARFLVRSGGFTSCSSARRIASIIHDRLHVQIDLGSAVYPFEPWIQLALGTLRSTGIDDTRIAILSEGESLFGESAEESETSHPSSDSPKSPSVAISSSSLSDHSNQIPSCKRTGPQPDAWNLEFPRDISALRSAYQKQGVLNIPSSPEFGKRSLQIGPDEGDNGDTIRAYGGVDTVAAQESVLFGISDFLRGHGIRAVIVVATSEQDSYFLTQFVHANNVAVRIVILGSSRQFMRGSTAQFRGDMMVGSFPLLPRLYDWTAPEGSQGSGNSERNKTEHTFPNDLSQGEYIAARDLLWERGRPLPHEYSRPGWEPQTNVLRPPVYISALGGGSVWPISELEPKPESEPDGRDSSPSPWRLSMPFAFAERFGETSFGKEASDGKKDSEITIHEPEIRAAGFWKVLFLLCMVVPVFYCSGVLYANPIERRAFAYLQPADAWSDWIFLITVPALLSEFSFLLVARQVSFPPDIPGGHEYWWVAAVLASMAMPALIIGINWRKGSKAGSFAPGDPASTKAKAVFLVTIAAALVLFAALILAVWPPPDKDIPQILSRYREMHWESGLSLLPTTMFAILAIAVWNYGALIGISVLRSRPRLPDFPDNDRISEKAGKLVANAGRPLRGGKDTGLYWTIIALTVIGALVVFFLWPGLRPITSLADISETRFVIALAGAASLLMLLDMVQFGWVWIQLHDLLSALDRQPFRRSFVPLREFNWKSIWTFSNGSLQEMRKVLAAQIECANQIKARVSDEFEQLAILDLTWIRQKYVRLDLDEVGLKEYRDDLNRIYRHFRTIGTDIASAYPKLALAAPSPCAITGPRSNVPFNDEERELEKLPEWLCLYERFLCLAYVGFIQAIIARLRSLAISIVSVFSLIALGIAVYPFQPALPLFMSGAAIFAVIGVIMFLVFSQMDKDPILARILQSDPNKLEWSFYSKYIDALALPLLTLLSSLLPGGAGRLFDLLLTAFGHTQ